jgi:surface carbohydrate biosynthesis protein
VSRFTVTLIRLQRYASILLRSKKVLAPPSRSQVLIYDDVGNMYLSRLLHPLRPPVLHVRGEELNLPVLLRALLRRGSLANVYEDCYIEFVQPSLILTFIDNSPRFYLLADRHPGVRTMFVQNGWRGGMWDVFHTTLNRSSEFNEKRRVDVMCTYGDVIGNEYVRHLQGQPIATGSFLCNEYPITTVRKVRRIAYISIYTSSPPPVVKAVEIVLPTLKQYCSLHRIPLVIVGRTADANEEKYYRDLLGQDLNFYKRTGQHSSYQYLDESEISVSIDSSLGYETAARGNKNAFFSVLGRFTQSEEFNFGWPADYPDEGPFWTNVPNPASFARILDHLLAIDTNQWMAELAEHRYADLIKFDPGNYRLKNVLADELALARRDAGSAVGLRNIV